VSAALTIDREQRDTLQSLMAYRLFLCHEVRLKRLVAVEEIALQFSDDIRFMQDIGWLERWLMEKLDMPEAEEGEFELTMPRDDLIATWVRARTDARLGAIKRTPTETDEERRARSRSPSRPAMSFSLALTTERRHHEHQDEGGVSPPIIRPQKNGVG
jgi:hypothetical protein